VESLLRSDYQVGEAVAHLLKNVARRLSALANAERISAQAKLALQLEFEQAAAAVFVAVFEERLRDNGRYGSDSFALIVLDRCTRLGVI